MLSLDPNGPIFKHAVLMGYSDPQHMSDAQLQNVVLDMAGLLTPPGPSPFTHNATDSELAQIADRKYASDLVDKVGAAMRTTDALFSAAKDKRWKRQISNLTLKIPVVDVPADQEFDRLEVLQKNLWQYLADVVPGWTGGIGQPNHETREALVSRLKGLFPDADAVVKP